MKASLFFLAWFSVAIQPTEVELRFNNESWVIPRSSCLSVYRSDGYYGKAFVYFQKERHFNAIIQSKRDALEQCQKAEGYCKLDFFICRF